MLDRFHVVLIHWRALHVRMPTKTKEEVEKTTNRNDDDDDRCEIEYLYWVICHTYAQTKCYTIHAAPVIHRHSFIHSNEMIALNAVLGAIVDSMAQKKRNKTKERRRISMRLAICFRQISRNY